MSCFTADHMDLVPILAYRHFRSVLKFYRQFYIFSINITFTE